MSYVKGINIVIGADTTQLDAALNKIDRNTKSLNKELRDVNNSLKFDPKNTDLLAQKQKILGERANETSKRLDALRQAQEQVNQAYKNGDIPEEEYRQFQTEIAKTESQLKGYQDQLKKVGDEYAHHSSKLGVASEGLKDFGDKASDVSRKLAPASLAAGAALGLAAKSAIDFESAFAGVEKTVDGTSEQMSNLKQGIRDMAKEIPSSTTEISAVAEAAGQLGIETENVLDFTRVMIDMGNSTNLSAETAATTLARFANVTKMSQGDFDKLGSTIVALGNNFATTEAEIAAMAMNLGAAGTQVGMSQADILALATSLSSVGIEAQAGGTAMSKLMIEMQLASEIGLNAFGPLETAAKRAGYSIADVNKAVNNGGKPLKEMAAKMSMTTKELRQMHAEAGGAEAVLEDFAKIAGLSVDEFAKKFSEDAVGALQLFINGLNDTERNGASALAVLDDMGITEVRLRDAVLRSANATDILASAVDMSSAAWGENIALTNEANQRYGTTESKLQVTKNRFNDLAISLGEKILPHLNTFLEWLGNLVDKFDDLSPGMQEFIVKALAITAASAPLIGTIGKLSSGLGGLLGAAGKAGRALGLLTSPTASATASMVGVGSASTVASGGLLASVGGLSGLAAGLGGAVVAAAPFVATVGAVAAGGYLVYKSMQEEAIPSVDLFADHVQVAAQNVSSDYGMMTQAIQTETVKISEDTQSRLQNYLDMSQAVQQESMNMYLGLTEITDTNIASLMEKNQGLTDSVITNINRQKEDSLTAYQEMFNNTTVTTAEQEAEILRLVTEGSQNRINDVNGLKEELNIIFAQIKEQGTAATAEQQQSIDSLYEQMKTQAVQSMADSEAEQSVILNRLSGSSQRVTAEMVGESVKQFNTLYDESVSKAGAQRDEVVKQAELMKSELGGEYSTLADQVIADANRQYEATVSASSKTRTEGLDKLQGAYGDLYKEIDINTGNILNSGHKFERFWNSQRYEDKRAVIVTEYRNEYTERNYRSGGNYYPGYNDGLDFVPHHNFVARLHKGERVLTADENQQLKSQGFLDSMKGKLSEIGSYVNNIDQSQFTQNFTLAGTYVVREDADIKKIARELSNEMNRQRRG